MTTTSKKRALTLLLLGAVAVPSAAGWSASTTDARAVTHDLTGFLAANRPALQAAASAGGPRLVPLSAGEVAALQAQPAQPAPGGGFAQPAFQRLWERTDRPVASGQVQRSWYWGPAPNSAALFEEYLEGPGGTRLVQYFDKSRMEINNPSGDPNSPFFVTNGLLTVELISGKMQTGNSAFTDRYPADIPLASDPDDANAPTYLSFQGVSNTPAGDHPAQSRVGQAVTATINRAGQVGEDPTKASYPRTNIVYYDQNTRHNVSQAIWEFLNEAGPVYLSETGQIANARLSDPWFYATGLPISEAYWARVKVAGQMHDVMIQAFERRVVTYMPNGVPGFKVQMGNIGQHYFDWRYKDAGRPAGGVATPTPPAGTTPVATVPVPSTPAPPDCSDVPPARSGSVQPLCGPLGTIFNIRITGFQPNEAVSYWFTLPSGEVAGTQEPVEIGSHQGSLTLPLDSAILEGLPGVEGIWSITFEGADSHHQAIVYFKITPDPNATPTVGPTPDPSASRCDDVPASVNMTVSPNNCSRRGTGFQFMGRGFQPGENVGVWLTAPDQSVIGAPFQIEADGSGGAGPVSLQTFPDFPLGIYVLTMEGTTTRARAFGYFKLIP
ncbi:MAG TPA: hypothetical protein VFR15_20680 [Chloroflexia bacterium]|nr:hypothetical protein [Chloroflexia bacterium]